jgi:hypothetical protein
MQKIILILILISFSRAYAQEGTSKNIERLKKTFEQYAPCNAIYCFEYVFIVNRETKEIIIKTKRYNYQGNPKKRILTETKTCVLPSSQIKMAIFYPDDEKAFFITGEFQQELNDKKETIDTFIIDFNDDFLTKKMAVPFQKDFEELIQKLRE